MNYRRKDNWPAALALFIEEKRTQPFDWATNNCAFFACDWIACLMGVDPAEEYRAEVVDAPSAGRVLARVGGVEAAAFDAFTSLGWPEVRSVHARRGDVVSFTATGQDGPALGVCLGELSVFAHAEGLAFRATLDARKAWRIG